MKCQRKEAAKITALHDWLEEKELADVNSLFHFANYLREFIPGFTDIVQPLKQYRAKGAKWDDYKNDLDAVAASKALRAAVATHAPLVNPDFAAAVDYIRTGRPFMIFVDASDYGYAATLCQAEKTHGTPRPIAAQQEF